MFDIQCHICNRRYLVGSRSIESFDNTSTGPIAHVSCPHGHIVVRSFGARHATDRPAPEVVAAA